MGNFQKDTAEQTEKVKISYVKFSTRLPTQH